MTRHRERRGRGVEGGSRAGYPCLAEHRLLSSSWFGRHSRVWGTVPAGGPVSSSASKLRKKTHEVELQRCRERRVPSDRRQVCGL